MQLLFTGAVPGPRDARGERALLGILDTDSGEVVHRCEYRSPDGLCAAEEKRQFTGFCFSGGTLFVCSFGEIVVFEDWPPQRPSGRITHPGFNDLHHCLPWADALAVANTGLETVDLVSLEGRLMERHDLLAGELDARPIDARRDYRRAGDTKPHRRHVNQLFVYRDELWATQLCQRDAIRVLDPSRRLELGSAMPHDGRWVGDRLLFTATGGSLLFAHPMRGVEEVVDLAPLTPGLDQLGWCRGVCADPRAPGRYFVAFTALRRSRWREFGYWIRWGHALPPSRVALYDLRRGRLIESWGLGEGTGWVLFQLEALPVERWL